MAGQSAVIGSLRVVLGLDSATFDAGLDQARAKAQQNAGSIGSALDSIFDSSRLRLFDEGGARLNVFGSALEHLGAVGIGVGVTLGVLALGFEEVKKSLEFADKLEDAAKAASVSTTALQEYRFAVHDLGGQYQDADKAITDFTVKFNLAAAGFSKKATKPFELLGLDAKSLGDTESGLKATIDAIHNLSTAGAQAAAAEKTGLTPMLAAIRAGGPEIDRLRQAAHDLGYVMDEDLIAKAGAANKQFQDLSAVIGVQFRSAFVELAPELISVTKLVADLAKGFAGLFNMGNYSGSTQNALVGLGRIIKDYGTGHPYQGLVDANRMGMNAVDAARFGSYLPRNYVDDEVYQKDIKPYDDGTGTGSLKDLTKPKNGSAERNASASAIDAALKEELAAEAALTENIARLAVLRQAEVDQEIKAKNDKLAREASEKKITQAAADQATALNNKTADEKKAKIVRDAQFALQNADLAQRAAIEGYAQQSAKIEQSLAATVQARNAIETKALADQQKLERDKTVAETDQAVIAGKMTVLAALSLLDAQTQAQDEQKLQLAEQQRVALVQAAAGQEQAALQLQADLLASQSSITLSAGARDAIALKILDLDQKIATSKAQEAVDVAKLGSIEREQAEAQLAALGTIQANQRTALLRQQFDTSLSESVNALNGLASAINSGDLGSAIQSFAKALQAFGGSSGPLAEFAQQLGFAGQAFSGGSALGGALSKIVGGNVSLGSEIGGAAGVAIGTLFGGPIGGIIGGAIVGAIGSLFGPGPSNFTASAQFNGITGAIFGGDKPNATTTAGAQQVAAAILQAEQALAASAGVTLGATVAGLQIGQRDPSKVTLSNGQILTSAPGDANAAVDGALKAVLAGAKFTDQAEQQLVTSMIAAGRGFNDIVTALGGYQQAQAAVGGVADQLLKFTNPQAYDTKQVTDAIKAQLDAAKAAAAAGDITADQLAAINDQLTKLQGLQIDQVVQKYTAALTAAAQTAVTGARSALSAAVTAQAAVLSQTAQQFGAIATSLNGFLATLNANGAPGAAGYSSLSATFGKTAAAAQLGDLTAGGALAAVAQQFDAAALAHAHSIGEYLADEARIRAGVQGAADTATRNASIAQQQLDALHSQTDTLLQINSSVLSVADAIAGLQDALAAQAALTAVPPGPSAIVDTSGLIASNGNVAGGPGVLAPPTAADIAALVGVQQMPVLVQIAKNTGNTADLADQWTFGGGLPTVSA